jgi:hypothetical protein
MCTLVIGAGQPQLANQGLVQTFGRPAGDKTRHMSRKNTSGDSVKKVGIHAAASLT